MSVLALVSAHHSKL